MNHCVPDFDMEDEYSIPTSSGLNCHKKSAMQEDEIMELLWQNGQVVMQSQTQRSLKKSPPSKFNDAVLPPPSSQPQQQQATTTTTATTDHLFMQEDEMASWLHYPLNYSNFDSDFCADLLYSNPCVTTTTNPVRTPHAPATAALTISGPRPPIPQPPRRMELESSTVKNFAYFSRHRARVEPESGPSNSKAVVKESTVVDSSDTPSVGRESRDSEVARNTELLLGGNNGCGSISGAAVAGTSSNAGREVVEMTVTSSPGGSSASAEPSQKPPAEVRKRKGREAEDAECQSEDVEFEFADAKKRSRGSTSTKRSRAAEVHNLSERRRRDRINEKMRALQELIPRCNKSDKASMLDEAIEYLKSLQLQVQMMSMGCGMVPMMFPGVQQYMAPMGMGFGMGMEMGMTRPMMPFPNALAGSVLPTPAAAAHLGPRFPMPAFHMPPVPAPDPSRIQATNQSDPMLNSLGMQNPNQPRIPNFAEPYQQYIGLQQMQLPLPQNQTMAQTSTSKPSSSRGAENIDNHQSDRVHSIIPYKNSTSIDPR